MTFSGERENAVPLNNVNAAPLLLILHHHVPPVRKSHESQFYDLTLTGTFQSTILVRISLDVPFIARLTLPRFAKNLTSPIYFWAY